MNQDQLERIIEELEIRCWEKVHAIVKKEEGLALEYDESVICDVCRSVIIELVIAARVLEDCWLILSSFLAARFRRRQRNGVLRLLQYLRAPGVLRYYEHPVGFVALSYVYARVTAGVRSMPE